MLNRNGYLDAMRAQTIFFDELETRAQGKQAVDWIGGADRMMGFDFVLSRSGHQWG